MARPVSESRLVVPPIHVHYALVIHHTLPLPKVRDVDTLQDVDILQDEDTLHVAIARGVVGCRVSWWWVATIGKHQIDLDQLDMKPSMTNLGVSDGDLDPVWVAVGREDGTSI